MNNKNIILLAEFFSKQKANQQEKWEKVSASSDNSILTEDYDLDSSYCSVKTIEEFKTFPQIPKLMLNELYLNRKCDKAVDKAFLSLENSVNTKHIHIYDDIVIDNDDDYDLSHSHNYSITVTTNNNSNEHNIRRILNAIYHPLFTIFQFEENESTNHIIENYTSCKLSMIDIVNKWNQYTFPLKWNTILDYHLLYDYEMILFTIIFILFEIHNKNIIPTLLNYIDNCLSLLYRNYNIIIAIERKKALNNSMPEDLINKKELSLNYNSIKTFIEILIRVLLEDYSSSSSNEGNEIPIKTLELIEAIAHLIQNNDNTSFNQLKTYLCITCKENVIENSYKSILPQILLTDTNEQPPRFSLIVNIDNIFIILEKNAKEEDINIISRPYSYSFFQKLSKYYEITIISSEEENVISDFIEEMQIDQFIKYRFFKEKGQVFSDISLLGRDISKVIIIQNKNFITLFPDELTNILYVPQFNINEKEDITIKT